MMPCDAKVSIRRASTRSRRAHELFITGQPRSFLCGVMRPYWSVVVIQFSYGVPAAFADMCRGIESQRLEIASGSSSWGRAEDVFSLDRRRQKTVKRTFWISG